MSTRQKFHFFQTKIIITLLICTTLFSMRTALYPFEHRIFFDFTECEYRSSVKLSEDIKTKYSKTISIHLLNALNRSYSHDNISFKKVSDPGKIEGNRLYVINFTDINLVPDKKNMLIPKNISADIINYHLKQKYTVKKKKIKLHLYNTSSFSSIIRNITWEIRKTGIINNSVGEYQKKRRRGEIMFYLGLGGVVSGTTGITIGIVFSFLTWFFPQAIILPVSITIAIGGMPFMIIGAVSMKVYNKKINNFIYSYIPDTYGFRQEFYF